MASEPLVYTTCERYRKVLLLLGMVKRLLNSPAGQLAGDFFYGGWGVVKGWTPGGVLYILIIWI